jgi:hypothetical protein
MSNVEPYINANIYEVDCDHQYTHVQTQTKAHIIIIMTSNIGK